MRRPGAVWLLQACAFWLARGQEAADSTFYLDVVRDYAGAGSLRSVMAQVSSEGAAMPEVALSSFLDLGCLALEATGCEVATMQGRLDCLAWCEALPAGSARGALLQGTQCSCCPSEVFGSAVRSEGCDVACADQEDVIYGAPVFAERPVVLCGGAQAFSAFRQWDGLSPLGRRGAFAAPFGAWYEVVVAELPSQVAPSNLSGTGVDWTTYSSLSYFLHAVHVETGAPLFAHQLALGFLPECLDYDAQSRLVVAVARSSSGVYAVVLCPGCAEGLVKVIPVLSGSNSTLYTLSSPACSHDPEQNKLAVVVVPEGLTGTPSMLEVDLDTEAVTWTSSEHFEEVLALETCRPMPTETGLVEPKGFTALLADEEFLLAKPSSLARLDGQAIPRCTGDGAPCGGQGPQQGLVYLAGSASHPTHSFVFFASAPGGENVSEEEEPISRVEQSRCDGGSSGAFSWDPVANGQLATNEVPFDRTAPAGLELAAPRLVLGEFLSSGRQVMLSFDRPTLMGAVPLDANGDGLPETHREADAWPRDFPCAWAVSARTMLELRLDGAPCTWMTEQELVLDLPLDSPAEVGSAFFLRSGVIFGYAPVAKYSAPTSGGVYLVPPQSQARPPEPVVTGPREVDLCSVLRLDASASRHTAGQPNVSWRLKAAACHAWQGQEPEDYCNTTELEEALEEAQGALLRVAAEQRPVELKSVDVEAIVTNRWGVSASLVVQVNISQVPKPSVNVLVSPPSPRPFSGVALHTTVRQSGCVQTALRYSWRLSSVEGLGNNSEALEGRAMEQFQSASGGLALGLGWNSSNLLFPPLALAAGVAYIFELALDPVQYLAGYSAVELVRVEVAPSELRMSFRQPLLVVRRDQQFELDISPSFDPDSPEAVLPAPSWSCKSLEPEDACSNLTEVLRSLPSCHEQPAASACRPRPATLRLAASHLAAGGKVQLLAKVVTDLVATSDVWWRSPYLLQREASVAAEVVLSSALADLPAITAWIVSLSPWRLGEHEPLRLEGFAWDELVGQGTSNGYSNLQYQWAVERLNSNPLWEAARAALEGDAYLVPEEIYSPVPSTQAQVGSFSGSSLMLPGKSLVAGAQYRFILNVSDQANVNRFSIAAEEVKVVQSQPHLGALRVQPAEGISGVTEFTLEAFGWSAEEDGMPLLYDFGYYDAADDSGGGVIEMRLGSGPEALLATADLPSGALTLFVDVYTTWGGSLRATAPARLERQAVANGTAQRLREGLERIELNDPAEALAQLPVLVAQFEEANVSNSELMSSALGSWTRLRERALPSSQLGLPSWPPPGLGLSLSSLMQSARPLCRRFQGARLECSRALRPLVAASFPSSAVIDQLRLMPERVPEPVLKPETRLASSLIRSLTDVALIEDAVPVGRRLAENGSNATLNDPQEAVAWLLTSMAESHYALVPHLTPGELFEVTSPSMRFRSRRMERGESHVNQTVERPFLLQSESDFLNPSAWLYLSLQLSATLGLPEGSVASENVSEVDLPFTAFVALSDSLGLPREGALQIFGEQYDRQMPSASCFRWQEEGLWSRQGVVLLESGDCSLNLTSEGRGRALVALFQDDEQVAREILLVEDQKLQPAEDVSEPPVLAAFGGIAALLLLNVGLAALSRLADINVKANPKAEVVPRDYAETPGYKMVRVMPDFLVYGDAESGVHLVRSWLSACLSSHLFVGLYTVDLKVPIQQKLVTLITSCACATGSASILAVRMGFSAAAAALLGGGFSWPICLFVKLLYEWRPWCPAVELVNEVVDASEQARIRELLSDVASVRTDPGKSAYEVSSDEKEVLGATPRAKVILRKSSAEAVGQAAAAGTAAAKQTVVLSATPGMTGLRLGTAPKMSFLQIPAATPTIQPLRLPRSMNHTAARSPVSREGLKDGPQLEDRNGLVFGKTSELLGSDEVSTPLWHHWDDEDILLQRDARLSGPRHDGLPTEAGAADAAQRVAVAGQILAVATQVVAPSSQLPVPARALPTPQRTSLREAQQEVEQLLDSFLQEPPPVAQELWAQLDYEEQSVKHMQEQIARAQAAHVRTLQRPYVEEARQDLPEEVSQGMVLLAYLGSIGVFMAGAGCTMNYWTWIRPSEVGDYLLAIIGAMAVLSILEMLRMVLVLLVALARLETRRRSSQAQWTRKHPEVLEVKGLAPLAAPPLAPRRWPGQAEAPAPTPKGTWATKLPAPWWSSARGGRGERRSGWRRFLRKVAPEKERGATPRAEVQVPGGQMSAEEVKRRVEEREADQVAALMNMVPPWTQADSQHQPEGAARVRRAEAWTESAAKTTSKRTKSSKVRFELPEDPHGIVPAAPSAPVRRTHYG